MSGLRDPRTLVAIFGVIVAIISVVLAYRRHPRKKLSYEVLSEVPLFRMRADVKNRIQILFDGRPVSGVYLVMIKIVSTGNATIDADDYEAPVCIGFGERSEVLTAEIIDPVPKDLPAKLNMEVQNVSLNKLMMNDGDSITAKIFVSSPSPINISGRIAGVKEIKKLLSKDEAEERIDRVRDLGMSALLLLIGVASASMLIAHFITRILPNPLDPGAYGRWMTRALLTSILIVVVILLTKRGRAFIARWS